MTQLLTKPTAYNLDFDATTGDTRAEAFAKLENAINYSFTNLVQATTSAMGAVQLATDAQAVTGTSDVVVCTPGNLTAWAAANISTAYADQTLSNLSSASTARTNLGLGTMAVETATDYPTVANNLSDLADASTARTNLGLGTMAVETATDYPTVANNLSDLASAATARTNLGLGTGATATIGSGAGQLVACLSNGGVLPAYDGSNLTGISSMWNYVSKVETDGSTQNLDFTGLDGSTYDYKVVLTGLIPSGGAVTLGLRLGTGATPTWKTTGYYYAGMAAMYSGGTTTLTAIAGNNVAQHAIATLASTANGSSGRVLVECTGNDAVLDSRFFDASGQDLYDAGGWAALGAAMTAIRIFDSGGNFASGGAAWLYRRTRR